MRERSGGIELIEPDAGKSFWSVTSYDYVRAVTRNTEVFTSTQGFSLDDLPPEVIAMLGSIIAMDDPSTSSTGVLCRWRSRRERSGDDITSQLMLAEVGGKRLTPEEFGSFVILLASAGNDTTRTGLAWAMHLLSEHPEQKQLMVANFDELQANAIDEVLRWCSPVLHMRRTATADTEVGSHLVSAGDKVVVWYLAANHDPGVFTDPARFDILRKNAREHCAFGSGGPHFCLGASLARMEIRVVLEKLLAAFPDLHATEPPDLLRSTFVHGVKALPCEID